MQLFSFIIDNFRSLLQIHAYCYPLFLTTGMLILSIALDALKIRHR